MALAVVSLCMTTSGHLVDLLIIVSRCAYPSRDGGSGPTMSTHVWLNMAVGMSIFSTVMGCLVTFAQLQAAHSLHQPTTSAAKAWPDKAGCHQLLSGLWPCVRELVHLLEDCPPLGGQCRDVHLILCQRIDDLSDFLKYNRAGVRAEQEKSGKQGEPSVLISYHCPVTPTVTFML